MWVAVLGRLKAELSLVAIKRPGVCARSRLSGAGAGRQRKGCASPITEILLEPSIRLMSYLNSRLLIHNVCGTARWSCLVALQYSIRKLTVDAYRDSFVYCQWKAVAGRSRRYCQYEWSGERWRRSIWASTGGPTATVRRACPHPCRLYARSGRPHKGIGPKLQSKATQFAGLITMLPLHNDLSHPHCTPLIGKSCSMQPGRTRDCAVSAGLLRARFMLCRDPRSR